MYKRLHMKKYKITATASDGKSITIETDFKSVTTHRGTTMFPRKMTLGDVVEDVLKSNEKIININIDIINS